MVRENQGGKGGRPSNTCGRDVQGQGLPGGEEKSKPIYVGKSTRARGVVGRLIKIKLYEVD